VSVSVSVSVSVKVFDPLPQPGASFPLQVINDKHEEVMCKMGAIMASGILDGGGRNVTVGLRLRSGQFRMSAAVGLTMFLQYWYWYPLTYFISLAFTPTAMIGLNADLKMPVFELTSEAKPSLFAYPPPLSTVTATTVARAPTAVLSTTAKRKKKEAEKKKKAEVEGGAEASGEKEEKMETDEKEGEEVEKEAAPAKKEPEASSETLANPCRVVLLQEKFIRFAPGGRYQPVKPGCSAGILVFKDTTPDVPAELVSAVTLSASAAPDVAAPAAPATAAADAEEEEPLPPEPFEYSAP